MSDKKQKELFIALADGNLRVFPRQRVTLEVLRYIKANKHEFVRYIQHVRKAFTPEIMEQLTNIKIAVKVHNLVLHRDVYYLVNGEISDLHSADGLIAYLHCEVEYLIRSGAEAKEIEMTNMVKATFPGSRLLWY